MHDCEEPLTEMMHRALEGRTGKTSSPEGSYERIASSNYIS